MKNPLILDCMEQLDFPILNAEQCGEEGNSTLNVEDLESMPTCFLTMFP